MAFAAAEIPALAFATIAARAAAACERDNEELLRLDRAGDVTVLGTDRFSEVADGADTAVAGGAVAAIGVEATTAGLDDAAAGAGDAACSWAGAAGLMV